MHALISREILHNRRFACKIKLAVDERAGVAGKGKEAGIRGKEGIRLDLIGLEAGSLGGG